ncbi:hypothetical protein ACTFIW_005622 [Dictyostelium discoideum]
MIQTSEINLIDRYYKSPVNCFTISFNGSTTFFSDVCSIQSVLNYFKLENGYLETMINGEQIICDDVDFLPTTGEYTLIEQKKKQKQKQKQPQKQQQLPPQQPIQDVNCNSTTTENTQIVEQQQQEQQQEQPEEQQEQQEEQQQQHQSLSNFSLWIRRVSITISILCIVLKITNKKAK